MARDLEFGRLVVANRDLAVGDVVMEVTPTAEKLISCHQCKRIRIPIRICIRIRKCIRITPSYS